MMSKLKRILSASCVSCLSSAAYCDLTPNVDAHMGRRWSTVSPADSDTYFLGSAEFGLTAGLRLGSLPLALNADFGFISNNSRDLTTEGKVYSYSINSSNGYEIAGSVKAWAPTSYLLRTVGRSDVVPYIKIGHTLFTDYTSRATEEEKIAGVSLSTSDHTVKSTSDGFNYNIGARYSISKTVGITAEYMYTNRTQEDKVANSKSDKATLVSHANTHAAFLGAEVIL